MFLLVPGFVVTTQTFSFWIQDPNNSWFPLILRVRVEREIMRFLCTIEVSPRLKGIKDFIDVYREEILLCAVGIFFRHYS